MSADPSSPAPLLGTPLTDTAVRLMLLGAGELGKEVAIEAQRLGVEVIAVDRDANAPAMQAHMRQAIVPPTSAFSPSSVRFRRWLGASWLIPPIWMPIEAKLAKPQRA